MNTLVTKKRLSGFGPVFFRVACGFMSVLAITAAHAAHVGDAAGEVVTPDQDVGGIKALIDFSLSQELTKSGPGIIFFEVEGFVETDLGSICKPATPEDMVSTFIEVVTGPIKPEVKSKPDIQALIEVATAEMETLVLKGKEASGQQHICVNGGFTQDGTGMDEVYSFVVDQGAATNFIISQSVIRWIE